MKRVPGGCAGRTGADLGAAAFRVCTGEKQWLREELATRRCKVGLSSPERCGG